jgi:hypothetical protein
MKPVLFSIISFIVFSSCSQNEVYTITQEPSGTKVVIGTIPRSLLETEENFNWFKTNYRNYALDSLNVEDIKVHGKSLRYVIVLGTWCGDSKHNVPPMFKVFDKANISSKNIEMHGVDRLKNSSDGISEKYKIQRVPTLIVFDGERELGRITETWRETLEIDLVKILQKK